VGGGIGGGGGNFWSQALGVVGGLLGGFFAEGGRPPVGKASVVGEKGPEWFVPDRPGTVLPTGMALAGGPSVTVQHYFSSGLDRAEVAGMLAASENRTLSAVLDLVAGGGAYRRGIRT
jgi:hypothetical protein